MKKSKGEILTTSAEGLFIPIINQSAIFVGRVVGFLNVLLPGVHPQRGHNKNRSFPYR
jgi:hypothetical protein